MYIVYIRGVKGVTGYHSILVEVKVQHARVSLFHLPCHPRDAT